MEAMIMPDEESPPPNETTQETTSDQLLSSPATSSLDSGFSSCSTGSNSLGRPTPSLRKHRQPLWRRLHNPLTPKKPQALDPCASSKFLILILSDHLKQPFSTCDKKNHINILLRNNLIIYFILYV